MNTTPVNLPARITPAVASYADIERIARFLQRMRVFECPCCGELYPPERHNPFGVCLECFDGNESAEDHFVFPGNDNDLKALYLRLYREVNLYDSFGPIATRKQERRPQLEWDMLQVLISAKHDDLKRLEVHGLDLLESLRWTRDGFMPITTDPLPTENDKLGWHKLRNKIFFNKA